MLDMDATTQEIPQKDIKVYCIFRSCLPFCVWYELSETGIC